jgi:hypothetical protein
MKILLIIFFMKLVLAFGGPPVTLKVVLKAPVIPKIVSNAGHKCTLENINQG